MIMKQFIAFVKKEFYHIFRDRRTMLILLGMPVVQIILFGFAISTEVKNVRLAVLDPSNDVVTRKIIDRLDASEYFTVTTRFHSPQEMETAFRKNKIDMAIVFGERFADGLYTGDARVQLIVDATDPNMSISQSNYAASIVSSAGQEMLPPEPPSCPFAALYGRPKGGIRPPSVTAKCRIPAGVRCGTFRRTANRTDCPAST